MVRNLSSPCHADTAIEELGLSRYSIYSLKARFGLRVKSSALSPPVLARSCPAKAGHRAPSTLNAAPPVLSRELLASKYCSGFSSRIWPLSLHRLPLGGNSRRDFGGCGRVSTFPMKYLRESDQSSAVRARFVVTNRRRIKHRVISMRGREGERRETKHGHGDAETGKGGSYRIKRIGSGRVTGLTSIRLLERQFVCSRLNDASHRQSTM